MKETYSQPDLTLCFGIFPVYFKIEFNHLLAVSPEVAVSIPAWGHLSYLQTVPIVGWCALGVTGQPHRSSNNRQTCWPGCYSTQRFSKRVYFHLYIQIQLHPGSFLSSGKKWMLTLQTLILVYTSYGASPFWDNQDGCYKAGPWLTSPNWRSFPELPGNS